MDALDQLMAIEAIRTLKARYCIAVDIKDAALLASVLAADAQADFTDALKDPTTGVGPEGRAIGAPLHGRDAIVAAVMRAVAPQVTVHHCSLGDIVVESPTTARAVWPMVDRLRRPAESEVAEVVGYGHYHETYVRTDGTWRIQSVVLTRLRVDLATRA